MQMQSIDHVHHNAIAMSNHQVSARPNIINMIAPMQSQQVPYQVIPKNMGPNGRSQAIADQHHFVSAPQYAMHNPDLAYNHQLISDERRRGQAIAASVQRQHMLPQAHSAHHHNHTAPPQLHTNHHPVNEANAIHYPQVITNSHQFVPAQYAMHKTVPSPMFGHDSLAINQHGSPAYSGIHQYQNVPIIQANVVDPRRAAPAVYTHHQHAQYPQNPIYTRHIPPQVQTALPQSQNVAVSHSQSEVLKKLVDIQISNNFVQVSNQLSTLQGDEGRDKLQDFFAQFDLCTQNWAESDKIRLLKGKIKGKASKALNTAIQNFLECQSKNSQSFDELIMVANKLEMLDKVKLKARVDPHPDIGYYHQEAAPPSVFSSNYSVPKYNTPKAFHSSQSAFHPSNSQKIHIPKVSRANALVNNQVQWNHPEINNAIQLSRSPEIQDESPALICNHISVKESPDFLEIFQDMDSMNDHESLPPISTKEISPQISDNFSNSPQVIPAKAPNSSPTIISPSPTFSPAIPPHSPKSFPAIPHHPPNTSYKISPPSLPIPTLRNSAIQTKSDIPNGIIDSPVLHSPPNIHHKHQRKKGKKKGRNAPNSKGKMVEPSIEVSAEMSKKKASNSVSPSLPESNKLGGTSSRVGGGKASAGSRFSAVSHRKEFSRFKDSIRSDQAVGEIPSRPQSLLAGNFPKPVLSRPPSLLTSNFPIPIRPPSLLALKLSILQRPQSLLVGNFPNPFLSNYHHSYQAPFGPSFSCLKGTIRT